MSDPHNRSSLLAGLISTAISVLVYYKLYDFYKRNQSLEQELENNRNRELEELARERIARNQDKTAHLMAALAASQDLERASVQRNLLLVLLSVLGLRALWPTARKYLKTYQTKGVPATLRNDLRRATVQTPAASPPRKAGKSKPRRQRARRA